MAQNQDFVPTSFDLAGYRHEQSSSHDCHFSSNGVLDQFLHSQYLCHHGTLVAATPQQYPQSPDLVMQGLGFRSNLDQDFNRVKEPDSSALSELSPAVTSSNHTTHLCVVKAQGTIEWPGYPSNPPLAPSSSVPASSVVSVDAPKDKPYRCTWCHDTYFRKPSDWKRHEESQHVQLLQWVCMPRGPVSRGGEYGQEKSFCVLCKTENPPDSHKYQCKANIHSCVDKPLEERTFLRQDKLIQHLQAEHDFPKPLVLAARPMGFDQWRQSRHTQDTQPTWSCGFCCKQNMAWNERCSHIGKHVRTGDKWGDWRSCICTKGLPNQLASTNPVVQKLLSFTCKWLWTCGYNFAQDSVCNMSFKSEDLATEHYRTHHFEAQLPDISYRFCCRAFEWPFADGGAGFWCGICQRSIIITTTEADLRESSYDCQILHHVNKVHMGDAGNLSPGIWHAIPPHACDELSAVLRICAARSARSVAVTDEWIARAVCYNRELAGGF